jgi:hypothetical protein
MPLDRIEEAINTIIEQPTSKNFIIQPLLSTLWHIFTHKPYEKS